jgi:inner membrane protein
VGHALAGMAAGWLVVRPVRAPLEARLLQATALAIAGALPDIDFLIGTHSGPTHGLGSALIFGLAVAAVAAARWGRADGWRYGLALTAAYATHTLLDWMGNDTTAPIGIMALWPFNYGYYESDLHVFMAISRRHWLPNFWAHNLTAVAREVAILAPLAVAVWIFRRTRLTNSHYR